MERRIDRNINRELEIDEGRIIGVNSVDRNDSIGKYGNQHQGSKE